MGHTLNVGVRETHFLPHTHTHTQHTTPGFGLRYLGDFGPILSQRMSRTLSTMHPRGLEKTKETTTHQVDGSDGQHVHKTLPCRIRTRQLLPLPRAVSVLQHVPCYTPRAVSVLQHVPCYTPRAHVQQRTGLPNRAMFHDVFITL